MLLTHPLPLWLVAALNRPPAASALPRLSSVLGPHRDIGTRRRDRFALRRPVLARGGGGTPPSVAYMTLPDLTIDGDINPCPTLTDAENELAARTVSPFVVAGDPMDPALYSRTTFMQSWSGGTLAAHSVVDNSPNTTDGYPGENLYARIRLTTTGGFSVSFAALASWAGEVGPNMQMVRLSYDDGTEVDSMMNFAAPGGGGSLSWSDIFTPTVPADGWYRLLMIGGITSDTAGAREIDFSYTATGIEEVASIRASYDDGSGIQYVYP
jgi:hypothetical protein